MTKVYRTWGLSSDTDICCNVNGSSVGFPDIGAMEYACCMLMLCQAVGTVSDQIRTDNVE